MTPENKKWESIKAEYIHKVEKALSSVKHPRGKEVLEDVRSHLDRRYLELAPEQRTSENFQSIITEMGPASDYAELLEPQALLTKQETKKKYLLGLAAVVIVAVFVGAPFIKSVIVNTPVSGQGRLEDKIDYPFVNDPAVIGAWKSVDFVETKEDFKPDRKNWEGELWLNHLIFEEGGSVVGAIYTWTKGLVINEHGKTASAYDIKEIGDADYMFFEWKSGDYTIRHQKPCYYVLKRVPLDDVKSEAMFGETAQLPSTSIIDENGRIIDKIDYPFVNDPEVIGAWKSVDFVETKEDFKPDRKDWKGELWLNHLIFEQNGSVAGAIYTWTKDLVINGHGKTASAYDIKKIGDADYMFFEWKSGDYTIRHQKPSYYVLKRVPLDDVKSEAMFGETAQLPPTSIIDENGRIVDKIDYPFVNDPEAIGAWESVDFVGEIEDFKPGIKSFRGELFLKELFVIEGGKTNWAWSWTKGLFLHSGDKTASKYLIEEIDGETYVFLEWKSGDYVFRHSKPSYYVLKKVPDKPFVESRTTDKIDYPFVNDPDVIGTWKSIDFVETPDEFIPGTMQWTARELFLKELIFLPEGKMSDTWRSWTKGLVIHPGNQTASRYIFKEIDGSTYMFFEWKSGDYTLRGMKPKYYVLRKE